MKEEKVMEAEEEVEMTEEEKEEEVKKVNDVEEEETKEEEDVKKEEEEKKDEEDVKKEEVVVGEEEENDELFAGEFEGDAVEVVKEPCVKRPRAPLTVTKETILAAIDRGDVAYLRANQLTTKKTINTLFVRSSGRDVRSSGRAGSNFSVCTVMLPQ